MSSLSFTTGIAIAIAFATLAIAFFVSHQPCCPHHCPHHCNCHRHHPCCNCLPATLITIALAAIAIALFVTCHPCHQCHSPCCPCPLCRPPPLLPLLLSCRPCPLLCCPHNLPHTIILPCCLPSWSCGCQRSLASHHPPLTLLSLVDCCFSPLLFTGRVWGHHLPLLFSGQWTCPTLCVGENQKETILANDSPLGPKLTDDKRQLKLEA